MMDFLYLWMIVQILYNFQCILYMTLYTKGKCLKSCRKMNELIGEIVAPVSLKRIALIFVTNAAGPQAFVKLIPW